MTINLSLNFPAGFLWGTAAAAHQVEGGDSPNNWTAWEQLPGHIFQDQRVGKACDWWGGRYAEDFDRAAELHLNAFRLSVEWSRIEPARGKFNGPALDYYNRVIDALRGRGMEPMVTLHHFTDPQWIVDLGGWTNPETIRRFERFARLMVDELGQSVTMWCTINEPMVYATQGYLLGRFPPGQRNLKRAYQVAENMLRAHAAAYRAIKKIQPGAQVGFAKHQISLKPRRPALLHIPARNMIRYSFNRAWVEALTTGMLRFPSHHADVPEARDTLDWIGLNYYYRFLAGFHPRAFRQLFIQQSRPNDGLLGPESVGEIWPEGLFDEIKWLSELTGKPLYITENGLPDADDSLRPLHMIRSIRSVWQAINYNYPVKGYFYWTLVDNFEWAEGYDPRFRFGLYGCDPDTQQRFKKRSADLYGEICGVNALTADMARRYVPDSFEELFPSIDVQAEVNLPPRE